MFPLCRADVLTARTITIVRIPGPSVYDLNSLATVFPFRSLSLLRSWSALCSRSRFSSTFSVRSGAASVQHSEFCYNRVRGVRYSSFSSACAISTSHFISSLPTVATASMDNFFVNALVWASLCKVHSSYCPSNFHLRRIKPITTPRRSYHTSDGKYNSTHHNERYIPQRYHYSARLKSELTSIVDPYFNYYITSDPASPSSEPKESNHQREILNYRLPRLPWVKPADPDEATRLQEFLDYIEGIEKPLDKLFELYRRLPAPRVSYLTTVHLDLLLSKFMSVPKRDEPSMLRYLSILDDLRTAGLPIKRNEWNAGISFVGRSFWEVTQPAVKAALDLWKESEDIAGVPADVTTFNILFDIISRTDTPMLAELVVGEMHARGIDPNRFTRTSIIMYHGICNDGSKVRDAYRDLVDAGEIVDIVVLNAVMSALLRAGEPYAAEYVYEKIKLSVVDEIDQIMQSPPPLENFLDRRRWGRMLCRIAVKRRYIKQYMEDFNVSLNPDIITFNQLLLHYCRVGHFAQTQRLLKEMKEFNVQRNTSIYVSLCKGFYWHSWKKDSEFTKERFVMLLNEVSDPERGIFVERSLAIWLLMATSKVFNSKKKLIVVWESLEEVCARQGSEIDPAAVAYLESILGREKMEAVRREREQRRAELEPESQVARGQEWQQQKEEKQEKQEKKQEKK